MSPSLKTLYIHDPIRMLEAVTVATQIEDLTVTGVSSVRIGMLLRMLQIVGKTLRVLRVGFDALLGQAYLTNFTNINSLLWCVTKLAEYIRTALGHDLPHLHTVDVASSLKLKQDPEYCSKPDLLHGAHGNHVDLMEEVASVTRAVHSARERGACGICTSSLNKLALRSIGGITEQCLACFENCIDRSVDVEVQFPGVILVFSKRDPGMCSSIFRSRNGCRGYSQACGASRCVP